MNLSPIQYFKKSVFYLVFLIMFLLACKDDDSPSDPPTPIDYGYAIEINSPSNNSNYSIGDTLPISVKFLSETGEIVHFIGVEIYSKSNKSNKLYSVLSHQHVLESFSYNDNFILKDSSKIALDSDWILETSLWSHEADADTTFKILELKIEN
ncbi:MAG: hypothetical protein R2788_10585 [Saprospiraceae bacterium]